ncbi:Protein Turtle-like B [Manis pentadactyla]|nr:Protein Turtle-like B [Manis pentadactyla]
MRHPVKVKADGKLILYKVGPEHSKAVQPHPPSTDGRALSTHWHLPVHPIATSSPSRLEGGPESPGRSQSSCGTHGMSPQPLFLTRALLAAKQGDRVLGHSGSYPHQQDPTSLRNEQHFKLDLVKIETWCWAIGRGGRQHQGGVLKPPGPQPPGCTPAAKFGLSVCCSP